MDIEKLTEENIQLKALLSGFFESVPGIFLVLDNRWRLIYIKGELQNMFTGDEQPLIGRPLEEVFTKNFSPVLNRRVVEGLIEGREKSIIKYSNSLHRWFMITAIESHPGVFIRLEDVTKEQSVNRLLQLNEYSISQASDIILWIKPGGRIIYMNQAAIGVLEYSVNKMTGFKIKIPDIDLYLTDNKWHELVKYLRLMGHKICETSFRKLDGSMFPVEVTYNYVSYENEEYIFAYARNIQERKKAEKAMLEAKAEAELYVDLMGHDINNMNQVAMGFLELAMEMMEAEGKIDMANVDLISKPYDMLVNSSRLIENVRKIQREKAGDYESNIMDVGKVLGEVRDSYTHVPGRDVTIRLSQNGECRVVANELLKDVFMNLVGNSIKHSKGPLRVSIEMKSVTNGGRTYCQVSVEDDGPGITDEMKKKLLEAYGLVNARNRGKGFGLHLIRQLVDDFRGKFWIEDRVPGDYTKGARFVVMLPAAGQ
jgi:PAS domain S-box-containing protein